MQIGELEEDGDGVVIFLKEKCKGERMILVWCVLQFRSSLLLN